MDKNVESVRRKLSERAKVGLRKYGVTTERTDLTSLDWLRHLQNELLDAAVYAEREIQSWEEFNRIMPGCVHRPSTTETASKRAANLITRYPAGKGNK